MNSPQIKNEPTKVEVKDKVVPDKVLTKEQIQDSINKANDKVETKKGFLGLSNTMCWIIGLSLGFVVLIMVILGLR